jgi:hypothetical protein
MEDLRPKTQMEGGAHTTGRTISTYTEHLPRFTLSKKTKNALLWLLVFAAVAGVVVYPFEIGDAIGYWVHGFWTGLTHRF